MYLASDSDVRTGLLPLSYPCLMHASRLLAPSPIIPARPLAPSLSPARPFDPSPPSPQVDPMSKEQDEALRKWMDKTPAMAVVKGGAKPGTAGSGKGKGDKKGAKGGKKKK